MARQHVSRPAECQPSGAIVNSAQRSELDAAEKLDVEMAPTRSSFLAKWSGVPGASGYRLDVSLTGSFASYVGEYHDLDVGAATSRIVSGLNPQTRYYYRVRAYNAAAVGPSSGAESTVTASSSGLVIHPTFDSSITSNPRSAVIQAAINHVIATYQPLFQDPITVSILFRFSNTQPDGQPMGDEVGQSDFGVYRIDWPTFIARLKAHAKTSNDTAANASLPAAPLTSLIVLGGPNGRALGLNTPPATFSNGHAGAGGAFDGIVTMNLGVPIQFSRPPAPTNYDGFTLLQHEIDEILGLGSRLNAPSPTSDLRPEDLFSWSTAGARNTSKAGLRYFSIDGGTTSLVPLNQNPTGDFGDWASSTCPQTNPYVQNAFGCKGQSADISAISPEGIALDVIGFTLATSVCELVNISTRLNVGTGDNVLIGGFVVGGSGPKQLVLRALGPTLSRYAVTNVLQNPILELHDGNGTTISSNDDWQQAANAASIPANYRPPNALESVIYTSLNPGSYTAIVRGINNTTGTALVEAYDVSPGTPAYLTNISTRGSVDGANVMIAGLSVQGGTKRVVVRGLGPTLRTFGIANSLANPTLELHGANGALLISNDNWKSTQAAEISATNLAPSNELEAAIATTLLPGNYTAILRGANNTSGVALVEVYAVQ